MEIKKTNLPLSTVLFLICLGMFCILSFVLGGDLKPYVVEQKRNRNLAHEVQTIRESISENREEDTDEPLPQYAGLYEQNHDFVGWLRIEGTRIDYPVMYRPEEPEYYLHRDFWGNDADSGSLFLSGGTRKGGLNTIIYGHHMADGSMFAKLLSYQEQEFADKHPVISFDTCYEEGKYQVAAAFYQDLDTTEEDSFAYYEYVDLSEKDAYYHYIEETKARSLICTNVRADFGDELITLSTCSYHRKNERFVVVAKKIEDEPKGAANYDNIYQNR